MRGGGLSDDFCNRIDPKVTMKVTVTNVPWCVDNYTLALCSDSVESLEYWIHWRSPRAGYHNSKLDVEFVCIL